MQIGFIGLGRMGSRMVQKLVVEHEVVVWNRSEEPINDLRLKIKDLNSSKTIPELVGQLTSPRIIWSMLPAGEVTEQILSELSPLLESNDILIDGGNSNYKDTQRRFEEFGQIGVRFLGIGVSGGLLAFENGYPLMVGGDKSAYDYIEPILSILSKPNGGYEYFGQGGAGHFVKMVHNGIEYGMMQSLGEGLDVLQNSAYKFNLLDIAKLWQKGTIVSSFLLDRAKDALEKEPDLSSSQGPISESGEAKWTVETAKEEGVQTEIIQNSLEFRKKSQADGKVQNSFTARVVNALRKEFGGHEIQK